MDQERVKALRKAKGWTLEKMAWQMGVAVRTVARWERGEGRPSGMAERMLVDLEVKAGIRVSEEELIGRIFREISRTLQAHGGEVAEVEIQALAERVYGLMSEERIRDL